MRTGIKPAGLRLGVSLGFVAKHTANLSKDLVNAVNAGIVYKHTVMNADEQVVNAVIDENQDVIVYAETGGNSNAIQSWIVLILNSFALTAQKCVINVR